jgi:DNA-binding SARP family transcriptional activator/virulence-associated protein VapD
MPNIDVNMYDLQIRLLGKPAVTYRGENIIDRLSKKALALLVYLAVGPKRKYRREELSGLLWGEMEEDRASYNFRRELWSLRREIRPQNAAHDNYVKFEKEFYFFDLSSSYWLDVEAFDSLGSEAINTQLTASNRLPPEAKARSIKAIHLYQGDFMAGFRLLDCPAFEDWMFFERERMQLMYQSTLRLLTRCAVEEFDYSQAIGYCKKLIEIDVADETAHQELMRIYYNTGNRQEALRQYQILEQTLHIQLGLEPIPETKLLYEKIRQGIPLINKISYPGDPSAPRIGTREDLPFVGRVQELLHLKRVNETALAGNGTVIALIGEAGVGKTRLVEEFLYNSSNFSAIVLQSRCYLKEETLPYQPVIDALRSMLPQIDPAHLSLLNDVWLAEITKLLPELNSYLPQAPASPALFPEQERNRLFEGMAQFLTHLSQRSNLILFLDDVHFADEPTLELIHYLGRRLKRQRLIIIIALRQTEAEDNLSLRNLIWSLKRAGCIENIQLGKLTEYEVNLLLSEALPQQSGMENFTHLLYEESGGNPFFLTELLHSIEDIGELQAEKIPIPNSIRDLIYNRLLRLNNEYRRVLNAASVIGRKFPASILEQLYPGNEEQVIDALAWLLQRHWFEEIQSGQMGIYDFKHGLLREVIYQSITLEQRRHLHLKVGLALETRNKSGGEMAGVLASHFWEAGDLKRAQRYTLIAADYSLGLSAYKEAKNYYMRALESSQTAGMALSTAEYLDVISNLGNVLQLLGEYDTAVQTYHRVLTDEMLNPQSARETLADHIHRKLCFQLALTYDRKGEHEQALYYLNLLENQLPVSDDPQQLIEQVMFAWGTARVYFHQEQNNQSLALCNKALALLSRLEWSDQVGGVLVSIYHTMAQCYFNLGNYDTAVSHYEHALESARLLGQQAIIPRMLIGLGNVARRRGDYSKAEEYAHESLALCQKIGLVSEIALSHGTLGNVSYNRGDLNEAFLHFKQSLDIFRQVGELHGIADYCLSLAFVLLEQDQVDLAERYLLEAAQIGDEINADLVKIRAKYHLAKVAVARADFEAARSSLEVSIAKAKKAGIQLMEALGMRLLGEISAGDFETHQAERHILESLEILEKLGERFEVAWTLRSYGRLLAIRGEQKRALTLMEQASAIFEDLEALRELAKTYNEISRLNTN